MSRCRSGHNRTIFVTASSLLLVIASGLAGCGKTDSAVTVARSQWAVSGDTRATFVEGSAAQSFVAYSLERGDFLQYSAVEVSGASTWVSAPVGPRGVTVDSFQVARAGGRDFFAALNRDRDILFASSGTTTQPTTSASAAIWVNILPGIDVIADMDLAVDALSQPWIAYVNETSQAVQVMRLNTLGTWERQTVALGEANKVSLAVDLDNRPVLAWTDRSGRVFGAVQVSGQWVVSQVWSGDDAPGGAGRAVDVQLRLGNTETAELASLYPRLVWQDDVNADLWYAEFRDGIWHPELAASAGAVGSSAVLAVDDDGNLWIAHFDRDLLRLLGTYRQNPDSNPEADWFQQILADDGVTGLWPDIADGGNGMFVLYYNRSKAEIVLRSWSLQQ